jgi:hypothetical protein
MKATHILSISGVLLLLAVFVTGIYIVPKLQSGSPATARQSDASRVSLSDVFLDATCATPEFIKRVKPGPYLQQWQNRAQPFLVRINIHVGTIADLDLRGKVMVEDSNGDRFPLLGTPVVLSERHNMYLLVFPLVDNFGQPIFAAKRGHFKLMVAGVGKTAERILEWKLPVIEPTPARTIASTVMLVLSVVGAFSLMVSTKAAVAAQQIEVVCDATHVNAAADIHSDFESVADGQPRSVAASRIPSLGWLAINPVDLFRAVNLSRQLEFHVSVLTAFLTVSFWLLGTLGLSFWKLRRTDL